MQLFFKVLPNFNEFVISDLKNPIKIYQTTICFKSKIDFMQIKNRFFLVKKLDIQVIGFMIMLTRSSDRIFDPMRYIGYIIHADKRYIQLYILA